LVNAAVQALAPRHIPQEALEERQAATAGRPLRVLLAEDGPVNQEVAVGLLEMRGHSVLAASNGKETLAALENNTFDVVLMDLEMPEMDGVETTAAIRERERREGGHVPIVAMTAHALAGCRDRCLEAGMDDYITKPINPDELFRALEAIATTARAADSQNAEAELAGAAGG
jgi:CheY-like chemotaxis protein